MTNGTSLIAALEQKRRDALTSNDKAALEALLSEDLIWTHATGAQDSKASYLANFGKVLFLNIDAVDEVIAFYGDAAAISSELRMQLQPPGKDPIEVRSRASVVWAREGDDWKLTRFHSGMIS